MQHTMHVFYIIDTSGDVKFNNVRLMNIINSALLLYLGHPREGILTMLSKGYSLPSPGKLVQALQAVDSVLHPPTPYD